MFTFYNTTTEYYKLNEIDLKNLYDDYKEYCDKNRLDYTECNNFSNFNPIEWISEILVTYKIEQEECNEDDLFIELMKINNKQEIRDKITKLRLQIEKLEKML